MPINLDELFTGYANITSTPIYRGGGREPQSGGLILHVNWKQPNGISWCYLQLCIMHKAATFMANLITCHVVIYSQLSGCPGGLYNTWTVDWTMDSWSFKATQPLFSAFSVIFSCLAIMLSVISASGMEHINGSMQTGEDYSNSS